jgi:hypothetical protein
MCHHEALVTHASAQTNQEVSIVGVQYPTVQAFLEAARAGQAQLEVLLND